MSVSDQASPSDTGQLQQSSAASNSITNVYGSSHSNSTGSGSSESRLRQYKNNGMDAEEGRRRRDVLNVQLRKQRREEHICKRRTGAQTAGYRYDVTASGSSACLQQLGVEEEGNSMEDGSVDDKIGSSCREKTTHCDTNKSLCPDKNGDTKHKIVSVVNGETISIDDEFKKRLHSSNSKEQADALHQVRRLLSREPYPPIGEVIEAGLVPKLVDFLRNDEHPELQFESAWAITNMLSGSSEHTEAVMQEPSLVSQLIRLAGSPYAGLKEQAVWALSNMAGDNCTARDIVIHCGAMRPLMEIVLATESAGPEQLSLLRNSVWCLSNLCRGKQPPPHFPTVSQCLPLLARLLFHSDSTVVTEACWTIGYLADGSDANIQTVINAGVVRGLVRLFLHSDLSVICAALRAIGNIVTGDDIQTQLVIDCGVLPGLGHVLTTRGYRESVKKECCWAISNITAGNKKQIQAVIDANLIPLVVEVLWQADFKTRKEAAWVLTNAASGGTPEQVEYLVNQECILPLCRLATGMDTNVVLVALNGLATMLKAGQYLATKKHLDYNPIAQRLEECGGLEYVESLQTHDNREVYKLAFSIMDTFLSVTSSEHNNNHGDSSSNQMEEALPEDLSLHPQSHSDQLGGDASEMQTASFEFTFPLHSELTTNETQQKFSF